MAKIELKACAHCGGEAELDYEQGFFVASGNSEKRVAIYCTNCDADMGMCYSDFPEYDHDQMAAILAEKWNRRVQHVASPAAPVEGLETVGYGNFRTDGKLVGMCEGGNPNWTGSKELVTRSQAEAIIVAKDARIADLENELSSFRSSFKEQTSLRADNAALTKKNQELEAAWLKAEALLSERGQ